MHPSKNQSVIPLSKQPLFIKTGDVKFYKILDILCKCQLNHLGEDIFILPQNTQ